jgi:hypothetical protein
MIFKERKAGGVFSGRVLAWHCVRPWIPSPAPLKIKIKLKTAGCGGSHL